MTIDPMPQPPRAAPPEQEVAVFSDASVVQVIGGDPRRNGALVVDLDRVRLRITDRRVIASNADVEWEWSLAEMTGVIHAAAETWTIFQVPGVEDFGVSVAAHDVAGLRHALRRVPGLRESHQEPPTAPLPTVSSLFARDVVPPPAPATGIPRPTASPTSPPPPPPVRIVGATATVPVTVTEATPPPHVPVPPTGFVATEHRPPADAPQRQGRTQRSRRGAAVSRIELSPQHVGLAGIDARNVSAWFGPRLVLDRVSLQMQPGKVTALIGPSGCGKSTFLRILNRMHEMIPGAQMAGEVLVDGHDIYDPERKLTDARREVGMVFQKPNPFPAMSIYDNVLASFRLTGVKASQSLKDEIVESCLSKAGLWKEVKDRLRQPGGGLSGGQQQRLCIARALALTPRVLLMDEPCSALDPTSTRRIEETIIEIVSEVTIVIVTHNMQQASRVSDHCAFFLAEHGTPGVIVEHGPTRLMFDDPQDPRTFDYVNGRFG